MSTTLQPNPCAVCHEVVTPYGNGWIHVHGGDAYCGTGDGATAFPSRQAAQPCPNCGSHWNMTSIPNRKRYGCFSCLTNWWSLRKVS